MTTIGLISDVHATPAPLEEALSIFEREGVDQVFCAGDIAGYRDKLDETIALLAENGCTSIIGNHDLMYIDHHEDDPDNRAVTFLKQLPSVVDVTIEGKRIYMVHAQPPAACHGGIKLRDRTGEVQPDRVAHWAEELKIFEPDVLIVGHTHQVLAEPVGDTLIVNPGSTAFNYSCAILRLPEMTVQNFPLSGKAIENTWNWSDHMLGNGKKGIS